jgi:DNA-binding LacI/PurR family transcriptional regulator
MVKGDVQISDGKNACSQLFDLAVPPTAIIAGNYKLLLGALEEIENRRIGIPGQISILGFDDYVWNRYFNPSLTAVSQLTSEMGKRAFQLLRKLMMEDPHLEPFEKLVRLPTELRVRNSTAVPCNDGSIDSAAVEINIPSQSGSKSQPAIQTKKPRTSKNTLERGAR